MENLGDKYSHIKGWGIDADSENEPTYPMKKYTGDDHKRRDYEKATQQPVNVEILHSNERPDVTRVFGTSSPPSGLSGVIRRFAFKFSESEYGHWLPLLLADRVNALEGIFDDLKRGHIPNIFAERGWKAEWEHNRKSMLQKIAIGTIVTAAAITLISAARKRKKLPLKKDKWV